MLNSCFKPIQPGLIRERSFPLWGQQDIGISPGGPMDMLAMVCANRMVENRDEQPVLEILLPPLLEVMVSGVAVLTGGHLDAFVEKTDGSKVKLEHAVVFSVEKGDRVRFTARKRGFRTVLAFRECDSSTADSLCGKSRGDFSQIFSWQDPEGLIRVIEGPEFEFLENSRDFFDHHWKVSTDSSDMGMRLEGGSPLKVNMGNMISDAVADGTIQLTTGGPIILLKHRQTVGGYPRIFNVISADVDLLGQFMPGQVLKFKKISPAEAEEIAIKKREELESLFPKA